VRRTTGGLLLWCVLLLPGLLMVGMTSTVARPPAAATAKRPWVWDVSTVAELESAVEELKAMRAGECSAEVGALHEFGGMIRLSPGIYAIHETIRFEGVNGVNLIGSGWGTILEKVGPGDAIVFVDTRFSEVRNMQIAGDPKATCGSGVVFRGKTSGKYVENENVLDHCKIRGFAESGVRFEGNRDVEMSSNTVSNCSFIGNRGDQLYSFFNNDFFISGNQFGDQHVPHGRPIVSRTGAMLEYSSAGTYDRNYHWSNMVALRMTKCQLNRVINNRFEESYQTGIILGDPSHGHPNPWHIFIGNTIHTHSKSAKGKFSALEAYNVKNLTFCDNQILSWEPSKFVMKHCLELDDDCKFWIIKDNVFGHCTREPLVYNEKNGGHIVKDNQTLTWR
jgi:hypothetical protein